MLQDPTSKYRPFAPIDLTARTWPDKVIAAPPLWCSVDLRDGNQALIEPMDAARKRRMFDLLVRIGFKEIEVGFPAASQTDFDFVRELIERNLIPDDVTVQVLTQARPELIERTFESLRGAQARDRAPLQLDVDGAAPRGVRPRPAPASSTSRCRPRAACAIFAAAQPRHRLALRVLARELHRHRARLRGRDLRRRDRRVAADAAAQGDPQSAGDGRDGDAERLRRPDRMVRPPHREARQRSCCRCIRTTIAALRVAAAELGVMAGADRVEGTLFGNGERTGNVDIVTLALNLYTQGVDPGLDFSNINEAARSVEYCNQLPIHPRHPYAGDLVFTAFSGSHQDAIKKGFAARRGRRHLGSAVSADRSARPRPHLRVRDPRQQPVRQGRHRVSAGARLRPRRCRGGCRSSSARSCSRSPTRPARS